MEISEAVEKQEIASVVEEVRKRNEHQPHAQGPCRTTVPGQIKAIGKTLSCAILGLILAELQFKKIEQRFPNSTLAVTNNPYAR
jgi:hypothetical protein